MDWEEIILEFCLDITIKGFSKITIKNYKSKLGSTGVYFKKREILPMEITKLDIRQWILSMHEQGHQASTINVTVGRVKKLFDYMVEEKYLKENIFEDIVRLKVHSKIIYPLNDTEIKSILAEVKKHPYEHIGQRNLVILMLMLDCGLRINEVCSIKNKDILINQIVIRKAKNNKDRSVALSPVLKKEIIKYQRIKKKKCGVIDDDTLIISNKGGILNEKAIWQIMKQIQKKVTIRKEVRFSGHTLRHTYAGMQLRNGLDIFTLSLNMGHSSVQMTQNYVQTIKSEDFIEKSIKTSTLMNLK